MVFTGTVWSQTTSTSLRGTVTDQSGGIVAGASVTLTNTGTGIAHTKVTGTDGSYLFGLVQVGTYKVIVEKSGFATFIQDGIILELNQNGRLDVPLKVGQASETVEVKSNVVQVDTTSAVLGKVEDQRMINDLPLVERDTLQLGLLQAGVFAPDPDDGSGNPFSVSGQRSESLTFLLDGGDNSNFLDNNIVVNPNPDAVQEFKILTNNYDAQYGRSSGGIINQITKSGTNEFHGDAFEFLRNNVLNSRNYFGNSPSAPPFKRNVFGGTLGGPVKKDKTFFFVAYQGARRREAQLAPVSNTLSVPERSGNFGELCTADPSGSTFDGSGNCISTTGTQLINPITGANYPYNVVPVNLESKNYIAKYVPVPNIGTNGFFSDPVGAIDDNQGVFHLDHNLTQHDTLSFVYVIDDTRETLPFFINKGASTGGNVPVGSGFTTDFRTQLGTVAWVHTFGSTLLNEFRFSANRDAALNSDPTDKTTPAQLGFTNVNPDDAKGAAPPIIYTPSFNLGPSPQGPTKEHTATFHWSDGLTWTRGRHEFKFGGDISRIRNNFNFDYYNNGSFDFGSYGTFTGDGLADFVGGFWDNYYQFSNAVYGIRTTQYAIYGQDTWKILPHLTLNYGLRYEYYSPLEDNHNNILGFFPGKQSVVFPDAPPDILYPGDPGTPNTALVYPDRTNFAPRLGFAWDMFGNAKLVMRGGFGIFYDMQDGATNLQFGGQPPFGAVTNVYPLSYAGYAGDPMADPYLYYFGASSANPFPFASRGLVGTFQAPKIPYAYTTDPHFKTPYSENFNYGFQWQASRDMMLEAVYVGSLGRRLLSITELNYGLPSVMEQQLSQFGFVNTDCARPLAVCTGGVNSYDPNGSPTGATQLFANQSDGLSDSHQLQLTLDKRFSRQFGFRAAYTLAKTIDLTSGYRSRSGQFTDPLDHNLDRALADFDAPQRFVLSGIWNLPFDRGIRGNGFMKKVAGGWQANGIVTFQKGNPYTLYSGANQSFQNNLLDRVDVTGSVPRANPRNPNTTVTNNSCLFGTVTGNFWINPQNVVCNACPTTDPTCSSAGDTGIPLFTYGNLGRNALRGPGINNWDISLFKNTTIGEAKSIQFRAEFFNAFNHTQFSNPNTSGTSGILGEVTQTREDARIIQFGLKFYF